MKITMQDCRSSKMCRKGVKMFIEGHGLDWDEFRESGLDAEILATTNDELALRVIREKEDGR